MHTHSVVSLFISPCVAECAFVLLFPVIVAACPNHSSSISVFILTFSLDFAPKTIGQPHTMIPKEKKDCADYMQPYPLILDPESAVNLPPFACSICKGKQLAGFNNCLKCGVPLAPEALVGIEDQSRETAVFLSKRSGRGHLLMVVRMGRWGRPKP